VARDVRTVNVLTSSDHVVVVGAGLAGWRLVESLRREDYDGDITVVGDELHLPYDRPPLSKQVLSGKWPVEKAHLATDELVAALRATFRLGVRATHLDVASKTLTLADGTTIAGTHVAIAVGARARALSFPTSGPLATLRNLDDASRFSATLASLEPGATVAVIGGGFVGAEVATSLLARELRPVVLEAAVRPLLNALGADVSSWLAGLAGAAGVELRCEQRILDVRTSDDGYVIETADAAPLFARTILAAVGSTLDLDWLEDSDLTLDDGVVVDSDLQAGDGVAAIGDVARFRLTTPAGEELVRIEHWQVAIDHAAHLAHYWVTGERARSVPVPYFWSDQYGKKLQLLGHPDPSDEVVMVHGSLDEGRWLALYSRHGVVSALVSLSQPRALMLAKHLLESPTPRAQALAEAPWSV
jgi:3-phenylpropionate/trans-cinnamate dioxygenase ferredoxin reductase subunit